MEQVEEVWKPVFDDDFSDVYEVSDKGNVRRSDTKQIIKPYKNNRSDPNSKYRVSLNSHGKKKCYYVHNLVGLTFLPDTVDAGMNTKFLDGDPSNCALDNLLFRTKDSTVHQEELKLDDTVEDFDDVVVDAGSSKHDSILDSEVWKDIDGYDCPYQVSNLGRVRAPGVITIIDGVKKTKPPFFLPRRTDKNGVTSVRLTKNGNLVSVDVSSLASFDVNGIDPDVEYDVKKTVTYVPVDIPKEVDNMSLIMEKWGIIDKDKECDKSFDYYGSTLGRVAVVVEGSAFIVDVDPITKNYDLAGIGVVKKSELKSIIRFESRVETTSVSMNNAKDGLEDIIVEDLEGEVWKPVSELPGYEVSNIGRVKNNTYDRLNGRNIESLVDAQSYQSMNTGALNLRIYADGKYWKLHRLVAKAFIDNDDKSKNLVLFKDGNPRNCKADNLYWGNVSDTVKTLSEMTKGEIIDISKDDEHWYLIDGFKDYLVSNRDRVLRYRGNIGSYQFGNIVKYKDNRKRKGYALYKNNRMHILSMQAIKSLKSKEPVL